MTTDDVCDWPYGQPTTNQVLAGVNFGPNDMYAGTAGGTVIPFTVYETLILTNSSGEPTNSDSLPAVEIIHNNYVDGSITPTITNLSTGLYSVSYEINVSPFSTDQFQAVASGTMSSVAWIAKAGEAFPAVLVEILAIEGAIGGAGTVPIGPYTTPSPSSVPIAGIAVTIFEDSGMTIPVPGQPAYYTTGAGYVFLNGLAPLTEYYAKAALAGYVFSNPYAFTTPA